MPLYYYCSYYCYYFYSYSSYSSYSSYYSYYSYYYYYYYYYYYFTTPRLPNPKVQRSVRVLPPTQSARGVLPALA